MPNMSNIFAGRLKLVHSCLTIAWQTSGLIKIIGIKTLQNISSLSAHRFDRKSSKVTENVNSTINKMQQGLNNESIKFHATEHDTGYKLPALVTRQKVQTAGSYVRTVL